MSVTTIVVKVPEDPDVKVKYARVPGKRYLIQLEVRGDDQFPESLEAYLVDGSTGEKITEPVGGLVFSHQK